MKLKEIETPISSLSGVGPATAKILTKAGIYSVADLLSWYPRDWEDRTKRVSLSQFNSVSKIHTIAQVVRHEWFGYGRMKTLKIIVKDESATAALICFNRTFLERSLQVGTIISLSGNFTIRYNELQSSSFETTVIAKSGNISDYIDKVMPDSAVFPVYPLPQGITQAQIRKLTKKALNEYCHAIDDEIPIDVIQKRHLLHKNDAIIRIHNPKTLEEALEAKRTLIYEELFHFQSAIAKRAIEHRGSIIVQPEQDTGKTPCSPESFFSTLSPRQKELFNRLPFKLTDDQMTVISEIDNDIDKSLDERARAEKNSLQNKSHLFTLARLLQGDVGSGKTLVAFFCCVRVIDWGGQCAIMAPTEILSRQHAENAAKMLSALGIRIAFLTGNTNAKGRNILLTQLKDGKIDLVIGTHALFSKNVVYANLDLVIIDEQHRFGVLQRNAILEKGRKSINNFTSLPGLLMMSATPIPRSLALTVFGDLDVSIIKTMPNGRKPIKTYLAQMGDENRVYDFVKKQLTAGRQAYFVYPRIEQDEESLKAAEEMFVKLSTEVFPTFKIALIHSKVDEEDQHQILNDFKLHNIDILVATTVVEVGVDVPNATCMVVEHADMFGLAALHQIRGRVGRGNEQSFCFLIFGKNISETGIQRMKALRATTDGFEIAEEDLKLRGPGEVSGIQQSGYLTLGIADPIRDRELLEIARIDALEFLSKAS